MALATVIAGREGIISSNNQTSWSTVRNDLFGAFAQEYTTPTSTSGVWVNYYQGRGAVGYNIVRSYFFFDVSAYAGSITAIDLNIDLPGTGTPFQAVPAQSTLAFGGNGASPLNAAEFDINQPNPPAPPQYGSAFTNTAGIATTPLNATAISDANTNGFLIIQLDDFDYDWPDIDPTPFGFAFYEMYINFAFGTNTLDVTYTSGYGNDVNGIASANISSINAVATANISTVIGI